MADGEAKKRRVGERVADLRTARGWVQIQLAEEAGLSLKTIQRVEGGQGWRGDTLQKLAAAFSVDTAALCPPDGGFTEVEGLRQHYHDAVCGRVREHVALSIQGGGDLDLALAGVVVKRGAAAVLGPSGCGKSDAALWAGLGAGKALPIWARARYFAGRFDDWLREVATSQHISADNIVMCGDAVLLIDGVNECPTPHRDALLDALIRLRARSESLALILTSTHLPKEWEALCAHPFHVARPGRALREALARAHGVREELVAALGDALTLPVDFQMAAGLDRGLPPRATTFAIRRGYAAAKAVDPSRRREEMNMLRLLARLLAVEVASAVDDHRFERLAQQCGAPELADRLQESRLLDYHTERWSFAHDSIRDYALAEDVLFRHASAAGMAELAADPRYAEARPLILEALETHAEIQAFLAASRSSALIGSALRGEHGSLVLSVAEAEAERVLGSLRSLIAEIALVRSEDQKRVVLAPSRPCADELAMWAHALGSAAGHPRSFAMADRLLEDAERAIATALVPFGHPPDGSAFSVFSAQLAETIGPHRDSPAGVLLRGAVSFANTYGVAVWSDILAALPPASNIGPLRWLLRCHVAMVWARGRRGGSGAVADDSGLCALVDLVLGALASPSARVLAEACGLAEEVAPHVAGEQRDRIVAGLESVSPPDNIWVSTALVEALDAYGRIDDFVDETALAADIEAAIRDPGSIDRQVRAAHIYSTQFESIGALSAPHSAAIERIEGTRRTTFLAAVIAGMCVNDATLFADVCLRELVACEGWRQHAHARDAVCTLAARIPGTAGLIQDDAAIFLTANALLAKDLTCVLAVDALDRRVRTWHLLAAITRQLHVSDDTSAVRASWREIELLVPESVSPLLVALSTFRFKFRADATSPRIDRDCASEVVAVLRAGLARREALPAGWLGVEGAVRALGDFGSERERVLLTALVDDKELAAAAVSALQSLNSRQPPRR